MSVDIEINCKSSDTYGTFHRCTLQFYHMEVKGRSSFSPMRHPKLVMMMIVTSMMLWRLKIKMLHPWQRTWQKLVHGKIFFHTRYHTPNLHPQGLFFFCQVVWPEISQIKPQRENKHLHYYTMCVYFLCLFSIMWKMRETFLEKHCFQWNWYNLICRSSFSSLLIAFKFCDSLCWHKRANIEFSLAISWTYCVTSCTINTLLAV